MLGLPCKSWTTPLDELSAEALLDGALGDIGNAALDPIQREAPAGAVHAHHSADGETRILMRERAIFGGVGRKLMQGQGDAERAWAADARRAVDLDAVSLAVRREFSAQNVLERGIAPILNREQIVRGRQGPDPALQRVDEISTVPAFWRGGLFWSDQQNGRSPRASLLYVAAQIMLRRDQGLWCSLKAWALNVAKSRGMAKACVALARKLAGVLHKMWITGEPFHWRLNQVAA
jgi:hypothetical protein